MASSIITFNTDSKGKINPTEFESGGRKRTVVGKGGDRTIQEISVGENFVDFVFKHHDDSHLETWRLQNKDLISAHLEYDFEKIRVPFENADDTFILFVAFYQVVPPEFPVKQQVDYFPGKTVESYFNIPATKNEAVWIYAGDIIQNKWVDIRIRNWTSKYSTPSTFEKIA